MCQKTSKMVKKAKKWTDRGNKGLYDSLDEAKTADHKPVLYGSAKNDSFRRFLDLF